MGITKILAEAQNLWMKLNLRGAILTSLSLQVFLIFFAPMRKRTSNWWFRTLMWLAYLVADSVTIYAFGLIARAQINGCTSDSEVDASGDLLAFWAPFLLLHLGGPDTMTAFALEDNELWLRHLLNLLFQLGTACYVFYQSLPSNKLIVPTILVFIGGTIKYIEQTRALCLASFSKFLGSLLSPVAAERSSKTPMRLMQMLTNEFRDVGEQNKTYLDDGQVITAAFIYFTTFKSLLVDRPFSVHQMKYIGEFFRRITAKDAFRVIEADLNIFYDVLYTKAAVIHCRTGYLFRAISIGSIITAFALFYILNKHGFHEYDIKITYILLLGAVGLEFVALSMLICSDTTDAKIRTSGIHVLGSIFLKFLHNFKSKSSPFTLHIVRARWSRSIFQYNMIDSQLRRWPKWIEKLIDPRLREWPRWIEEPFSLIPLRELFDDLKSGQIEPYNDKLGELIFDKLKEKAAVVLQTGSMTVMSAARGKWALDHSNTSHRNLYPFVCNVEYDESLLLWHIATELCYNADADESANFNIDRENNKVLSDYMFDLMIKRPDMISAVVGFGEIRSGLTCDLMDKFLNFSDGWETKTKESACKRLLSDGPRGDLPDPPERRKEIVDPVLFGACDLARELQTIEKKDRCRIMSEVWVELLQYAAIHCRPFMHPQQLSKGGELLTLVWLAMAQLGLYKHLIV